MSKPAHTAYSVDFQIGKSTIFNSYAAQTMRSAVLGPLAVRKGMTLVDSYKSLQKQWRARVDALAAAGWQNFDQLSSTEAGERMYFLHNCPPFGVEARTMTHCCHCWRVCPNCYAREVLDAYDAVEEAVRSLQDQADKVRLLGLREVTPHTIAAGPWGGGRDKKNANWAAVASSELCSAERFFKPSKILGGCYRFMYEPMPGHPELMSAVRMSLLLLLPLKAPLSQRLTGDPAIKHWETAHLTVPAEIARVIGACLRYPVGLMRGDPAATAAILNGLTGQKLRCSCASGLCNNKQIREIRENLKREDTAAAQLPAAPAADLNSTI